MTDEKKGFTVKDRRKFTAEGERRAGLVEEPEPETAAPQHPAGPQPAARQPAAPQPGEAPPGAAGAEGPFALLMMLLADQASALMSAGLSDQEALSGVGQIVSILEMLHTKTQGRLSQREERMLEDVLYQVRMAYLAKSQGKRA